ncbi:MAG: DUF2911 domain-containing protein [Cyclobacteriaceae bacterium]
MRKLTLLLFALAVCFIALPVQAQQRTSPKAEASGTVGGAKVDIVYCRPSADKRKIMGGLVPYGEVWRTGANAATTIEFDKAVKIEGKTLPAGKYALFTIPNENEWIIVINKDVNQQGAYNYDEKKDVLRVNVKPKKTDQYVETFTITPEKDMVNLKWENTQVGFKVKS